LLEGGEGGGQDPSTRALVAELRRMRGEGA